MLTDEEIVRLSDEHVEDPDESWCSHDAYDWPCPTVRLVAEVRSLRTAFADLLEATRRMIEDGHPCGSSAGDEWFRIMCERVREAEAQHPVSGEQMPGGDA